MSTATLYPATGPTRPHGASPVTGSHRHLLGDTLRAVRVYARAAFDVVVLGEYGEETVVRRRGRPEDMSTYTGAG
ncbi:MULTISPECIES: hypothetical protein [Streptomyces]|uniref:Uncharacterized protein n=2 Tax=Streptomyces TaxID=1883 RepID=A0A2U9P4D2_STRAS|nr:hypothetical protein [Streptomyces actuosus]AWT43945.1 hypothetical protein DMT42_17565 [Streptomyces actuosus]MBM4820916.1 hypothetical protein [Streptomyces actuosus]